MRLSLRLGARWQVEKLNFRGSGYNNYNLKARIYYETTEEVDSVVQDDISPEVYFITKRILSGTNRKPRFWERIISTLSSFIKRF